MPQTHSVSEVLVDSVELTKITGGGDRDRSKAPP
jgi:hypothetical protein